MYSLRYTFLKEDQEYDYRHRAICPRCASLIETPDSVKLQRVLGDISGGYYHAFPGKLAPNIRCLFNRKFVTRYLDVGGDVIYKHGQLFLFAFVVFFASIFVPVSKILIMLYLLASVHFKWRHSIKWQIGYYISFTL